MPAESCPTASALEHLVWVGTGYNCREKKRSQTLVASLGQLKTSKVAKSLGAAIEFAGN